MQSVEIITSRVNQKVLDAVRLKDRAERERTGLFCFEGKKLLEEAVRHGVLLTSVFCTERQLASVQIVLAECSEGAMPRLYAVSESVYDKISEEKSPEGIFCVAKALDKRHKIATIYSDDFSEGGKLFLCSIRDPGNVGTIVRTATALGLPELILSRDCADLYSKKTLRASMGTLFHQNLTVVDDPVASVAALRRSGYTVLAAALDKRAARLTELSPETLAKSCFVVGNEGHGLSAEIIDACDGSVLIPMVPGTESLNAAAAATILLWELRKLYF